MKWPSLSRVLKHHLRRLSRPLDEKGEPNLNTIGRLAQSQRLLELNVKAFGYELARRQAAALPPPGATAARTVGLASKPTTQADLESDWVAHWCAELRTPVMFHRKLWELAYVLQTLHDAGHLRPGARGLGFGCGQEPVPSYLAAHGVRVTVSDLAPEEAAEKGWVDTGQHATGLDQAFHPHLVDRATFDAMVDLQVADMNAIPATLRGYDFCWSMCAVEHLGSIDRGLAFLESALDTLRPGGLSVHTLEFNTEPGDTLDNWPTVLFQRRHVEAVAARLAAAGHAVAPLDFACGDGPLDRFVDLPPFGPEIDAVLGQPLHLKLGIAGFVSTCYGIAVRKAG